MLSSLPNLKISNDDHPINPIGNFVGSMSALLFDDSLDIMDVDKPLATTAPYLEECVEPNFHFVTTTTSTSASPFSDHTTLSRTSSDEGSSSNVTTSYASSKHFNANLANDINKIDLLPDEDNIEFEDFPYEDVLSLENALEEAIGDSLQSIQKPIEYEKVETPSCVEEKSWKMVNDTRNILLGTHQRSTKSIPPIRNIFPKITHRLVISPTTTLVLSDDLKQKKDRLVATNSLTPVHTTKVGKLSNFYNEKGATIGSPNTSTPKVQCQAFTKSRSTSLCSEGSTENTENASTSEIKPESSSMPSIRETDSSISDSSATSSPTQGQTVLIKKTPFTMQKQPLPPEGYKITRYPLRQPKTPNTIDENDQDSIDIINELRHELRKARLEISRNLKEIENWKSTAQHTFEAARKIRAQMELEKSRADRAESKISQISSHFRSKAAAKVKAKSLGSDKSCGSSTPNSNDDLPETESHETKKRSSSDVPIIISRKRRRTVPELDAVTKNLASWLMSSQHAKNYTNNTAQIPTISRSVSESVFGTVKQKESLVYTPQINSGVRLALRAKVCSARSDTLNTTHDLMKQTKLLLTGLPVIPDYNDESCHAFSEPQENKLKRQNRWSSVDDVFKGESMVENELSDEVSNKTMSHALSESNLLKPESVSTP